MAVDESGSADTSVPSQGAADAKDDTQTWGAVSPGGAPPPTLQCDAVQSEATPTVSDLSTVAASPASRMVKQATLGRSNSGASSEGAPSSRGLGPLESAPPAHPAIDIRSMTDSRKSTAAFLTACRTGDAAAVRQLLALEGAARVNVHVNGDRCVELAAENGHADVLAQLLALRGDRLLNVHARDEGALVAAASEGHTATLQLLLDLEGDRAPELSVDDSYPLRIACEFGHAGVVSAILAARAAGAPLDVHACNGDALQRAAMCGHVGIARALLALKGRDEMDISAVNHAAFREACRGDPGHVPAGSSPGRLNGTVTSAHAEIAVELLACTGPTAVPQKLWGRLRCGNTPASGLRRDAAWRGGVRRLPRRQLLLWAAHKCSWLHQGGEGSEYKSHK